MRALIVVLGVILFLAGLVFFLNPQLTREVTSVPTSDIVYSGSFRVEALTYRYIEFNVPFDAIDPVLKISLTSDKDVGLRVETTGGVTLHEERVKGSVSRTIYLPGGGSYVIYIDNSFSLLTDKTVSLEAILEYRQQVVREVEQASTIGLLLLVLGIAITIVGVRKK